VGYWVAAALLFSGVAQADVVVVQAGTNSFSVACPSGYVLVSNSVSFDCVDANGNGPLAQVVPAVNPTSIFVPTGWNQIGKCMTTSNTKGFIICAKVCQ
jgi:hypothetical protein